MKEFIHHDGDVYLVFGRLVRGGEFRLVYSNPKFAMAINLWKGRVWHVRDAKRKLLKEVS